MARALKLPCVTCRFAAREIFWAHNIAGVGFEMYCQLLEEAVNKLQNREIIRADDKPDPIISLPVEAFINRDYITNAGDKIEIYRRLAVVREDTEIKDLREELTDRFGKVTEPVENLLQVARIRLAAKNLGVRSVQEKNLRVEIIFADVKKIAAQGVLELLKLFRNDMKFAESAQRIFLTFRTKDKLLEKIINVLKILTPKT